MEVVTCECGALKRKKFTDLPLIKTIFLRCSSCFSWNKEQKHQKQLKVIFSFLFPKLQFWKTVFENQLLQIDLNNVFFIYKNKRTKTIEIIWKYFLENYFFFKIFF